MIERIAARATAPSGGLMSESRATTATGPVSGDQSLGGLVSSAVADLRRLIQMEKELAVAEVTQAGKRLAPAIAGFAVAAAAGVFILLLGSVSAAFGIADLFGIGLGWGFLITAGLWLLLAAAGALIGVRLVKKIKPPERTIRTVKDTADWARHPTNASAAALDVR
jgi:Putative Actinobacterial Holin-X, holin superfamily III